MLLRSKNGFCLLEVILTVTVGSCALGAVFVTGIWWVQRSRAEQNVRDMTKIGEAALDYYQLSGVCPTGINDLTPGYLPQGLKKNVYGHNYELLCLQGRVTVSSLVPAGSMINQGAGPLLEITAAGGGNDRVSVTLREKIGATGRLRYERKHNP